jgi:hypothetical protein
MMPAVVPPVALEISATIKLASDHNPVMDALAILAAYKNRD